MPGIGDLGRGLECRLVAGGACERDLIAARRLSPQDHLGRISAILRGVAANPAHRSLHILYLGREPGLTGEAVVDRHDDMSARRELRQHLRPAPVGAPIALARAAHAPAAAMHPDHHRIGAATAGGHIQIRPQRMKVRDLRKHHILQADHAIGIGLVGLRQQRFERLRLRLCQHGAETDHDSDAAHAQQFAAGHRSVPGFSKAHSAPRSRPTALEAIRSASVIHNRAAGAGRICRSAIKFIDCPGLVRAVP